MVATLGYAVVEASNGAEAIARLGETPDDVTLVLLDLAMPTMGGDEALPHLRAIRSDLPIVRMSGYAVPPDAPIDLRTGYLHKPFRLADLERAIAATAAPPNR
jgi:CheY-like chemotaxis protein